MNWDKIKQLILDFGLVVAMVAIAFAALSCLAAMAHILSIVFGWAGYAIVYCPALILLVGMVLHCYDGEKS